VKVWEMPRGLGGIGYKVWEMPRGLGDPGHKVWVLPLKPFWLKYGRTLWVIYHHRRWHRRSNLHGGIADLRAKKMTTLTYSHPASAVLMWTPRRCSLRASCRRLPPTRTAMLRQRLPLHCSTSALFHLVNQKKDEETPPSVRTAQLLQRSFAEHA
jgi:hypothetical protein